MYREKKKKKLIICQGRENNLFLLHFGVELKINVIFNLTPLLQFFQFKRSEFSYMLPQGAYDGKVGIHNFHFCNSLSIKV